MAREIEIWFVESVDRFYILAEHQHKAHWVKNILKSPSVHVRVGERSFDGTARVLHDRDDREAYAAAQRLMREKYDWRDGLPVEIVPNA
jgi:deazaflavin-dependent oxidoreductase (nitroreductase family)